MSSTSTSYRVGPTPDKGLGVFATRDIRADEVIINEARLFEPASTVAEIEYAVSRLSGKDKLLFWSFTDAWNPKKPTAHTIMMTNGIPSPSPHSLEDGGIYPILSRINHSCVPNVRWVYDPASALMTLRANVDIADETEFLVSYGPCYEARYVRQAFLKKGFGFDCHCAACEYASPSDIREQRIFDLDDLLDQAGRKNDVKAVLRLAKERLRLRDQEGMEEYYERSRDHLDIVEDAAICSDFQTARRHQSFGYAYRVLAHGVDHPAAQALLLSDPRAHALVGTGKLLVLPTICDCCGKEEADGFKGKKSKGGCCGECHCAVYCSRECKSAHLDMHLPICVIIQGMKAREMNMNPMETAGLKAIIEMERVARKAMI